MAENWLGAAVVVLSIAASHALSNRELRGMRKDMSALFERMAKDGFIAGFRAKGAGLKPPATAPRARSEGTSVERMAKLEGAWMASSPDSGRRDRTEAADGVASMVGMTGFEPATP